MFITYLSLEPSEDRYIMARNLRYAKYANPIQSLTKAPYYNPQSIYAIFFSFSLYTKL